MAGTLLNSCRNSQKNMLSSLWERGELECLPMGSQFTDSHYGSRDGVL